jgi:hypothetical protein
MKWNNTKRTGYNVHTEGRYYNAKQTLEYLAIGTSVWTSEDNMEKSATSEGFGNGQLNHCHRPNL